MLKCKYLSSHCGIIAPFHTSHKHDIRGVFLQMYWCMMWCMHVHGLMPSPFVCCLCLAHQVMFWRRVPLQSLTTANQRWTYRLVFKVPSPVWRTLATESRYSFHRMGSANPQSKRTKQIILPWMEFESPQPLDRQVSVLPQKNTTACTQGGSQNKLISVHVHLDNCVWAYIPPSLE